MLTFILLVSRLYTSNGIRTLREKCPYSAFFWSVFPSFGLNTERCVYEICPRTPIRHGSSIFIRTNHDLLRLNLLSFLLFPIIIFPLWFTCLNNWVLHFHIGFQLVSIVEFITLGNQSFSFISIYWFSIRFVFFHVANRWKRCIELISSRDHGHIYRPFRYYPIDPRRCIRAVP